MTDILVELIEGLAEEETQYYEKKREYELKKAEIMTSTDWSEIFKTKPNKDDKEAYVLTKTMTLKEDMELAEIDMKKARRHYEVGLEAYKKSKY